MNNVRIALLSIFMLSLVITAVAGVLPSLKWALPYSACSFIVSGIALRFLCGPRPSRVDNNKVFQNERATSIKVNFGGEFSVSDSSFPGSSQARFSTIEQVALVEAYYIYSNNNKEEGDLTRVVVRGVIEQGDREREIVVDSGRVVVVGKACEGEPEVESEISKMESQWIKSDNVFSGINIQGEVRGFFFHPPFGDGPVRLLTNGTDLIFDFQDGDES